MLKRVSNSKKQKVYRCNTVYKTQESASIDLRSFVGFWTGKLRQSIGSLKTFEVPHRFAH